MIRKNPDGHAIIEEGVAKKVKTIIIGKMVDMSGRMRTSGYKSMSSKIIAMVAMFAIVVAFSVVLVMRANESINPVEEEYLWFKVETNYPTDLDTTGDVYIYDADGYPLEHILLENSTEWQRGELLYIVRTYARVNITFWNTADTVDNVMYLVGRSPVLVTLIDVSITIVSDWEAPMF